MANNGNFWSTVVSLDKSRSLYTGSTTDTGSMVAGRLIPLRCEPVIPGDEFRVHNRFFVRSTTPLVPVMDDLYMDVYWFYQKNRRLLSRKSMSPDLNDYYHSWEAFIGAQDSKLNVTPGTGGRPMLPYINVPPGSTLPGNLAGLTQSIHLADWLYNLPVGELSKKWSQGARVICLPFLMYQDIWNDWFRDPNTMEPFTFTLTSRQMTFADSLWACQPVSPFHSYFGSALPWPQRNAATVTLPVFEDEYLPLDTLPGGVTPFNEDNLIFSTTGSSGAGGVGLGLYRSTQSYEGKVAVGGSDSTITSGSPQIDGSNLGIDVSAAAAVSINAFRASMALQHYYEMLARGGNKYPDLISGLYGVKVADDDRPELLGTGRFALSQDQVTQTSPQDGGLGSIGAYSVTRRDGVADFHKSFTDFGWIMCVACIRCNDTVSGGLERKFTTFNWDDYYQSAFAHLGEQMILNQELAYTGTAQDQAGFGYQEAWSHMRTFLSTVHGDIRPGGTKSYFTYAERFGSVVGKDFVPAAPKLNTFLDGSRFIQNVDASLVVPSATAGFQFLVQMGTDWKAIRPIPTHSNPAVLR